jgi:hypothetical protein
MIKVTRVAIAVLAAALVTDAASAACVNRFVARAERPNQVVTLLTGKLTFQEAQTLAKAIRDRQSAPLEILDDKGKTIARQFGDLKIVRPMPVGCDGKTSGVVMIVSFPLAATPSRKMIVKLDANTTVEFAQQQE